MYDNIGSVVVKGIKLEDNYYCIDDSPSLLCSRASLNIEDL